MIVLRNTLTIVMLILLSTGHCQSGFNWGIQYQRGFIAAHRPIMGHLLPNQSHAIQLFWEKRNSIPGYNKAPAFGINGYFGRFEPTHLLGEAIGICPYIGFYSIENKNIQWKHSFGWGLGALTEPYDRVSNYRQIAIGSYLNAMVEIQTQLNFRIFKQTQINTGISFVHFSNTGFKKPNLGYNIFSLNTGITIDGSNSFKTKAYTEVKMDRTPSIGVYLMYGASEIEPLDNQLYPALGLNIEYNFDGKPKGNLIGALDFFYNTSYTEQILRDSTDNRQTHGFQVGLFSGYKFKIDRISILTGMGIYVFDSSKLNGLFYHRIGTRFQLNERFQISLTLLSHWAKADHFEFGIGYKLWQKE